MTGPKVQSHPSNRTGVTQGDDFLPSIFRNRFLLEATGPGHRLQQGTPTRPGCVLTTLVQSEASLDRLGSLVNRIDGLNDTIMRKVPFPVRAIRRVMNLQHLLGRLISPAVDSGVSSRSDSRESVYFYTFHKCASTLFSKDFLPNTEGLHHLDYARLIYRGKTDGVLSRGLE